MSQWVFLNSASDDAPPIVENTNEEAEAATAEIHGNLPTPNQIETDEELAVKATASTLMMDMLKGKMEAININPTDGPKPSCSHETFGDAKKGSSNNSSDGSKCLNCIC